MSSLMLLLAAEQNVVSILIWSGVLMGAVALLFAAVIWVKRWARDEQPDIRAGSGFTLADLREMHRRGQITDEEFERARAKIVASARALVDKRQDLRDRRTGSAGNDL